MNKELKAISDQVYRAWCDFKTRLEGHRETPTELAIYYTFRALLNGLEAQAREEKEND